MSRSPELFDRRRRRVGAGQRQRHAAASTPPQNADGVPSLAALVQSYHAGRRRAPTGLNERRKHVRTGAPPELFQSTLPRCRASRRLLRPRLSRSAAAAATSKRVDANSVQYVVGSQVVRRRSRVEAPPASSAVTTAPTTGLPDRVTPPLDVIRRRRSIGDSTTVADLLVVGVIVQAARQLVALAAEPQSQPQRVAARSSAA